MLIEHTEDFHRRKKRKRVGRGNGSGSGTTCGRGTKGQKSRSGVSIRAFEGGQNPIYMRLPKRGFTSFKKIKNAKIKILNLSRISYLVEKKLLKSGDVVDLDFLVKINLVKNASCILRLLGKGDIKIPLHFKVNYISASAKKIVEGNGGTVELS